MTKQMTATTPMARRIRRFRWRDLRLWLGLALIIVSMLIGARVLAGPDGSMTVWRASRDLAVGAVPVVEPVTVQLGGASSAYAPAGRPLAGRMLVAVPAGALIPAAAVGDPGSGRARHVTVPVDALHVPAALTAGDRVDVWATPSDGGRATAPPALVLSAVSVVSADRENVGVGGDLGVVLDVPVDAVGPLIAAMRAGVVDLTAVPITDAPVSAAP